MATDPMAGLSIQYAGNGYGATDQSENRLNVQPASPPSESSTSSTSSASSIANFARLSMLVIDAGTEAIARKVIEKLPDSLTLDEALGIKYGQMCSLVNDRVINQAQFEVLYPPSGLPVDENEIDLTLWAVLSRNITAKAKKMKWVEDPQY
jgi:hypothetical protein